MSQLANGDTWAWGFLPETLAFVNTCSLPLWLLLAAGQLGSLAFCLLYCAIFVLL